MGIPQPHSRRFFDLRLKNHPKATTKHKLVEFHKYIFSVERIFEYTNLKSEESKALSSRRPSESSNDDIELTTKFSFGRKNTKKRLNTIINGSNEDLTPNFDGDILVEDFSYKHGINTPAALKDLSFEIKSGSKIGVVGRTGAGKSTLISAFFRMRNAETGSIKVNNVNIGEIELSNLRRSISIIPQDPRYVSIYK